MFFKEAGRRRLARQPALEGRRRRQRRSPRGFGGGGHKNAAGLHGRAATFDAVRDGDRRRELARRHRASACRRRPRAVSRRSRAGLAMDGVLVVDKPSGPTSHDVVARRAARARRAAHRPHRHARSAGDRRAAAACSAAPRAWRSSSTADDKDYDADDPLRRRRPTPTTRRRAETQPGHRSTAADARARSTRRSTRFRGTLRADAAGVSRPRRSAASARTTWRARDEAGRR